MYEAYQIAERIKVAAKSRNIVIKVMLEECGLSKNTLSSMISGGSTPKSENLAKIADYLNCSVDYLLGRTNEPNGVYQNSNSGNIVNGNNGDNSPLTVNGKVPPDDTDELVDLVKGLPLVKRAEAVLYLNDLKNKK